MSALDCEQVSFRMYRYLDGELAVWRRWVVGRHLRRCPPCAHGFDFELVVRRTIALRCREQVPPEVRRRILDALGAAGDETNRADPM